MTPAMFQHGAILIHGIIGLIAPFMAFITVILSVNLFFRLVIRYTEFKMMVNYEDPCIKNQRTKTINIFGIIQFTLGTNWFTTWLLDIRGLLPGFIWKSSQYLNSLLHAILSNEGRGLSKDIQYRNSPELIEYLRTAKVTDRRKVIMIRHAESIWNLIFNRTGVFFRAVALTVTLLLEIVVYCDMESCFLDSPLSTLGIKQCRDLAKWIAANGQSNNKRNTTSFQVSQILGGKTPCKVLSSNLRRAYATCTIGTRVNGIENSGIHMITALQESTRNPDGNCLYSNTILPKPSIIERSILTQEERNRWFLLNNKRNTGSKRLHSTLLARQDELLIDEIFGKETEESKLELNKLPIVLIGHSLYFRNFFRRFVLSDHKLKTEKIPNCGVVVLEICEAEVRDEISPTGKIYYVDEGTINVVYSGSAKQ